MKPAIALTLLAAGLMFAAPQTPSKATDRALVMGSYGKLPLSFEANRGQTDARVKFLARGPGYRLFLTAREAVLALREDSRQAVLRLGLVHASGVSNPVGIEQLAGASNYFIGNDAKEWHTGVPNYARVKYPEVYPGIDLVYHGNQRQLEYDFLVAAGADPGTIELRFEGATRLRVNRGGDLVVALGKSEVIEHAPVVYQEIGGRRQPVAASYVLRGRERVGFRLAAYDRSKPLVIDPKLTYSTFLGGSRNDLGLGIAVDASGNAYVTGETSSANFPTTAGAFQTTFGGGDQDSFVSKLNTAGSALVYSTYLGGSDSDQGNGIAVDASGNAYITGETSSANFPITTGAFQTTFGGDEAFVSKLNAAGSTLVYSTYLGGSGLDQGFGVAVDGAGNAYVTGGTLSSNFPTTAGAFQTTFRGFHNAFVSKLNPPGSALVYSTYLAGCCGDQGYGIAVDASGNAYVTGSTAGDFPTTIGAFHTTFSAATDAFVSKLNAAGSALAYSTYLGGNGNDWGKGIAVDAAGNAYVTGRTESSSFPTTPGAFQTTFGGSGLVNRGDAFVSKFNAAGSALVYSTYLGGSDFDEGHGIAADAAGNAYVTGRTDSSNFPTTSGAFQTTSRGFEEAFVGKLNATGSALVYSTYLGGSSADEGNGIALDTAGNAYVTGDTTSGNFPTTAGAFQTTVAGGGDAFVSKFFPGVLYEYDFYAPGTNTVVASFRFPGFVRDVSPASTPIHGFTGFISPSPASLNPCDLTSNSSGELDCRPPTVHGGIFYFVFDYGAFPSKLGPFTGSGFTAPDGATPGLGTVNLLNGQIIDVSGMP